MKNFKLLIMLIVPVGISSLYASDGYQRYQEYLKSFETVQNNASQKLSQLDASKKEHELIPKIKALDPNSPYPKLTQQKSYDTLKVNKYATDKEIEEAHKKALISENTPHNLMVNAALKNINDQRKTKESYEKIISNTQPVGFNLFKDYPHTDNKKPADIQKLKTSLEPLVALSEVRRKELFDKIDLFINKAITFISTHLFS